MKKVLILSYFFPPCNLTASQRISNWEKYLPEYGYYPLVVTRKWTGTELTEEQRLADTSGTLEVVQKNQSEVHYLPYKSSLRDRCYIKSKGNFWYKYLSKFLTLVQLLGQNQILSIIPYNNLYVHARNLIAKDTSIKQIIISANPYEQFFFGYLLKMEFPQLRWFADYRDDWNTSELQQKNSLLKFIDSYFERKWLRSAEAFFSVSPYYVQKISTFVSKPGHVIYNGYDQMIPAATNNNINEFIITYNGTLYQSQKIEIFLHGLLKLIKEHEKNQIKKKIHMYFPGLNIDPAMTDKVKKIIVGFETYFTLTDRMPKNEIIKLQNQSDFLLMVAHDGIKGIPSSKIFEYISLNKKFVLCPADQDILDEIAIDTRLGTILNTSEEVYSFLNKEIDKKNSANFTDHIDDFSHLDKYSARNQVKEIGQILDTL